MSLGNSTLATSQRIQTGTPFPAGTAFNGLSIDPVTGRIVLGNDVGEPGDPAQLVSFREMKLKGFYLDYIGNTIEQFFDDGNGLFQLYRNPAGVLSFNVDTVNKLYQLGEDYRIDISQTGNRIQLRSNAEPYFNALAAPASRNLTVSMGSPQIFLNDLGANKRINLFADATVPNAVQFGLEKTSNLAYIRVQTDDFFSVDVGTGLFQLGDINTTVNGSILKVDDANQLLQFDSLANTYLIADILNGQFALGDYTNFLEPVFYLQASTGGNPIGEMFVPDQAGNYIDMSAFHNPTHRFVLELSGTSRRQMRFDTDDAGTGDTFEIRKLGAPNTRQLFIDFLAFLYQFGDISGENNGTFISVADGTSSIDIANTAANAFVRINGTPGFTGTVTPVTTITVDGGIVTNVA